jgi:hypothetical protein
MKEGMKVMMILTVAALHADGCRLDPSADCSLHGLDLLDHFFGCVKMMVFRGVRSGGKNQKQSRSGTPKWIIK